MKVLTIAGTNLRRLFRERSNIFFVIVLPLLLILLLGSTFGGGVAPTLGIVAGEGDPLADELVGAIAATRGLVTERFTDRDTLLLAVERGRLHAGVVVPADYGARLRAGATVTVALYGRPDTDAQHLRAAVDAAVARQNEVWRAARFAVQEGVGALEQTLPLAASAAAATDGVRVEVVNEAGTAGGDAFAFGASTQLLLFVFLTSLTGGLALVETRTLGVSRRMLVTPTPVRTILAGEALGRFAVALFQGVLIMIGSALLFGVVWGDLAGALAVLVLFGLVGTGAAMLLASLVRNVQQGVGIALLLGLGLAAIGGSMVPLEVFPDPLRRIAYLTPHAWGNDAYTALIARGATVTDILPQLAVLAGYATVLLAVATWRLRASLTRAQ